MQTALSMNVLPQQRAFNGPKVAAAQKPVTVRAARFVVRAEAAEAAPAPKVWSAPALDPNTPSPIFGGSTGKMPLPAACRRWRPALNA